MIFLKNHVKLFVLLITIPLISNCGEPQSKKQKANKQTNSTAEVQAHNNEEQQITESSSVATIYLENSGSMFGYVSGNGNFTTTVSTIAADCDINFDKVSYNMVNGKSTPLGNSLENLLLPLSSVSAMNKGITSTSKLTEILEQALSKSGDNKISIVISDGIYSIARDNLIGKLKSQSTLTRNAFYKRLKEEDLTTYLIKYESQFKGKYYPAKGGIVNIDQTRPYYVWVIGQTDVINAKFEDGYFEKLDGFVDIVKFVKLNNGDVTAKYAMHKEKGRNRASNNSLEFTDVDVNNRREFAFSLALDFSKIPYAKQYFDNKDIYENNLGYKVISIDSPDDLKPVAKVGLKNAKYTHIVTLEKTGPPWGTMEFKVKDITPTWIADTNDDEDSDIKDDTSKTFGFKYLIDGISKAYDKINNTENIAEFTIKIKK